MNSGSSSLKFQLIDMDNGDVMSKGLVERIGMGGDAGFEVKAKGEKIKKDVKADDHKQAVALVIDALTTGDLAVVDDLNNIDAIGHRIVQGGDSFPKAAVVDQRVKDLVREYGAMAPLHNYAALAGIEACEELMPTIPSVCVFDTSYHMTMDPAHYMYAIPYEDYKELKVRRYGAHGTSHKYVAREAAKAMGRPLEELKLITCHLGNGSSITAIKDGKVIDTSMGLTPLDGFIMGSRCGGVDPSAITYLQEKEGWTPAETAEILNKKSGVLGISGVSSDDRDVLAAAEAGNERAALARSIQRYQIRKFIGAYVAAMDGVDAIVFTGGIGENTCDLREDVCKHLTYLGVKIDCEKNLELRKGKEGELSTPDSKVRVFVLPTNEELLIARDTKAIVEKL